ncbi:hypothetical protein MUG91_G1328n2, partial [Manis pentadactyla]
MTTAAQDQGCRSRRGPRHGVLRRAPGNVGGGQLRQLQGGQRAARARVAAARPLGDSGCQRASGAVRTELRRFGNRALHPAGCAEPGQGRCDR